MFLSLKKVEAEQSSRKLLGEEKEGCLEKDFGT
jgi:hypothetical protein